MCGTIEGLKRFVQLWTRISSGISRKAMFIIFQKNGSIVKRILFYSEGWGLGGIERFIINDAETLDHNKYSFDIFSTHDWNNTLDSEIKSMGGHRYSLFSGHKPNLATRLIQGTRYWNSLLKKNEYDIVHINTMNGTGLLYAEIARRNGVPTRIVHSHNTAFGSSGKFIKNAVHRFSTAFFGKAPTIRLSCSREAGLFLFGQLPFEIVCNGINVEQLAYSSKDRNNVRAELGIDDDALVFGSVGRLADVKNPLFQVHILDLLRSNNSNAYLLLVGSGPLRGEIMEEAKRLGLEKYVRLPGSTNKPASYNSALDVFTLPSIFEGSSISMTEAIANGLFCLCSDNVPALTTLNNYYRHLSLADPQKWVSAILQAQVSGELRHTAERQRAIQEGGFDIESMRRQLARIYASVERSN